MNSCFKLLPVRPHRVVAILDAIWYAVSIGVWVVWVRSGTLYSVRTTAVVVVTWNTVVVWDRIVEWGIVVGSKVWCSVTIGIARGDGPLVKDIVSITVSKGF